MNAWNCCRLCLIDSDLDPIFLSTEHSSKYSEVIYNATGVMVEENDPFPQQMCQTCFEHVNSINNYRKQCQLTQETLMKQLNSSRNDTYTSFDTNSNGDTTHDTEDLPYDMDIKVEVNSDEIYVEELQDIDTLKLTKKKKLKDGTKTKKVTKACINTQATNFKPGDKVKCEFCPKILTSKTAIRQHYKTHTGFDFVCEHCGKQFVARRYLTAHCRARHGYEKTDKCSYCDYRGSNAEQVKIHERIHTGEKPFVCGECGAGFHRRSCHLQHVATHLPEKTVQCDQCPARFKSVTLMRIHKNRHKPPAYTYKCHICASSFARRRNVLRHLTRIHAVTEPTAQHVERVSLKPAD